MNKLTKQQQNKNRPINQPTHPPTWPLCCSTQHKSQKVLTLHHITNGCFALRENKPPHAVPPCLTREASFCHAPWKQMTSQHQSPSPWNNYIYPIHIRFNMVKQFENLRPAACGRPSWVAKSADKSPTPKPSSHHASWASTQTHTCHIYIINITRLNMLKTDSITYRQFLFFIYQRQHVLRQPLHAKGGLGGARSGISLKRGSMRMRPVGRCKEGSSCDQSVQGLYGLQVQFPLSY